MRVVPVSIAEAAALPVGTETDLPCTVAPVGNIMSGLNSALPRIPLVGMMHAPESSSIQNDGALALESVLNSMSPVNNELFWPPSVMTPPAVSSTAVGSSR